MPYHKTIQLETEIKEACEKKDYPGIVLHHADYQIIDDTKQLIGAIEEWHYARKFNGIGYHAVIERDGTIYLTHRADEGIDGAHTKGKNDYFGICFSGGMVYQELTEKQITSGMDLIFNIMRYSNIGLLPIHTHAVLQGDKKCPGKNTEKKMYMFLQAGENGYNERKHLEVGKKGSKI